MSQGINRVKGAPEKNIDKTIPRLTSLICFKTVFYRQNPGFSVMHLLKA